MMLHQTALTFVIIFSASLIVPSHADSLDEKLDRLESGPLRLPFETLQAFKQLFEEVRNEYDRKSIESRLRDLIWASKMDEEKCTLEAHDKLSGLLEKVSASKFNTAFYLLYWAGRIGEFCQGSRDGDLFYWLDMESMLNGKGLPLGHKKSLEYVERLRDRYRSRSDSNSKRRQYGLQRLIHISQLRGDEACSRTARDILIESFVENASDVGNIIPYLADWRDTQAKNCGQHQYRKDRVETNDLGQDWRDIYDKIFTHRSAKALDEANTFQELTRLVKNLKSHEQDSYIKPEKNFIERMEKLLDFGIFHDSRYCNDESKYNEFVELFELYEHEPVNIIPYLRHQQEKMVRICNQEQESSKNLNLWEADPLEWKALQDRLFNQKGYPMSYGEVLETMKRIYEIIRRREDYHKLKAQYSSLISLSQDKTVECSTIDNENLTKMMDAMEYNTVNVLPYIKRSVERRRRYCLRTGDYDDKRNN